MIRLSELVLAFNMVHDGNDITKKKKDNNKAVEI